MRALITGANGFIGRALVQELKRQGHEVVIVASADGDVANYSTWRDLPPAEIVYHLAGRSFIPDSWSQSAEFIRINAVGTECALNYCLKNSARMVLASTYLYGIPQYLPICEGHSIAPNTPYGLSKRIAEELCIFSNKYHGLSTTILRLFNVYGPNQRVEFVVPTIVKQIKAGNKIIVNDLNPKRDYIYIDDVVAAFVKTLNIEGLNILNIGSGQSHSVGHIIAEAQSIAGTSLPVISDNILRPNQVMDVVADIANARRILNWIPECSISQGLYKIFNSDLLTCT